MNEDVIKHPNFVSNGKVYLVRCPKCNAENYALNVSTGICTWCGFDGNNPAQLPEQLKENGTPKQ